MSTQGLTNYDWLTFNELLTKANAEQLKAMLQAMTLEVATRNDAKVKL